MGNTYLLNALRNHEIWRWGVMVWGRSSSAGVEPIVRFHGNINASVYKELLHQHALPHLLKGIVETPIFMQNNAPCHKAKTVLSFIEEEGIAVMKWPPQNPDRDPIENVWKIIGKKSQKRNPQNIDDLSGFLKEEWESITTAFCEKCLMWSKIQCGKSMQRKIH